MRIDFKKYFKYSVLNNTFISIFSTSFTALFNAVMGIIISIFIARSLGVEGLGELAVILTFSSLILTSGAIIYGGFEILIGRDEKLFIFLLFLLLSFLVIEVLFIIGLLQNSNLEYFKKILHSHNVYYFFIFITIFGTLSDGIRRILNGRQHFQYINFSELLPIVVYAICIFSYFSKNLINIESIIFSMFIAACSRSLTYISFSIYLNLNNFKFTMKSWAPLREIFFLGIKNLFVGAPSYIPKILLLQLSNIFGNYQVGLFKIGLMAYEVSLIIPGAAANVLRGKAVSNSGSWSRSMNIGLLIFSVYLIGALIFYLIGDFLLLFIFGNDFLEAKKYVIYFIIIGAFASFYYILESEIVGRASYPLRMIVYGNIFFLIAIFVNNFIVKNFASSPLDIFPFLICIYFIWLIIYLRAQRFYKSLIK